jgi:NAD(P)-dependent dehydrogenase (short-subunit alcohol dehydrogenase family)
MIHPNIVEMSRTTRVALITGAAKRLGRAIACELSAAGWAVAVHYRRSQAEADELVAQIKTVGAQAAAFKADLNDEAQTLALLPAVHAEFGRIDAVVNNASLFEYDTAASFSYALAARQFAANTAAPVLLARELHRMLEEGGDGAQGCVVNLLDQKLWNYNPDYLSYTLSKAALQAATTMLAQALAPRLRVCGIAPGITLTSGEHMSAAGFAKAHQMSPLGRSSEPRDVAQAVRFLLDAPAITGHTLLVDGGQHLIPMPRDVAFISSN